MAAPVAILAACSHEAVLVRRLLHKRQDSMSPVGRLWQGTLHDRAVLLLQCGIGAARACQAVTWLCQHFTLAGMLSVGFAGGLQGDLGTGDALLCTQLLAEETEEVTLTPDARLTHIAAMAIAQTTVVSHTGPLLSTTSVIAYAAVKQVVGRLSGALAVDMESYSIAQTARHYAVPFTVLRTIFDTAKEDFTLPSTGSTTATGDVQPSRLAGCFIAQPWLCLSIPRWWWASRVAGHHLQHWLQHFFLLLGQGA